MEDDKVLESIIHLLEDAKYTLSDFERVSNKVHEHYLNTAILKRTIGSRIKLDLNVEAKVHKHHKSN